MREESRSNPAGAGWRNGESPSTTAAAFNRMKRARRAPGSVVAPSPSGRLSVLNSNERGPPCAAAGAGAPSQTKCSRATLTSVASHARGVRRVREDGQGLRCGSINLFVRIVSRGPSGTGRRRGALDRLNRRRLDERNARAAGEASGGGQYGWLGSGIIGVGSAGGRRWSAAGRRALVFVDVGMMRGWRGRVLPEAGGEAEHLRRRILAVAKRTRAHHRFAAEPASLPGS